MTVEIKEFTIIKYTNEIKSKQGPSWAKRKEAQWTWKAIVESLNETKGFEMIKQIKQKLTKCTIWVKAMHTIMSLSYTSIKSKIIIKLEIRSWQKIAKIEYKVDGGSVGNLMPLDIFQVLFPITTMEQLAKHKDKRLYYTCTTKQE